MWQYNNQMFSEIYTRIKICSNTNMSDFVTEILKAYLCENIRSYFMTTHINKQTV